MCTMDWDYSSKMLKFSVIILVHAFCQNAKCLECPKLKEEFLDPSLNLLSQEDPKLVEILKERYLMKPNGKKLNLTDPANMKNLGGQHGQPYLLEDKYFK